MPDGVGSGRGELARGSRRAGEPTVASRHPWQTRAHVLVGGAEKRLMRKSVLALLAMMASGVVGTASAQPVRGNRQAVVRQCKAGVGFHCALEGIGGIGIAPRPQRLFAGQVALERGERWRRQCRYPHQPVTRLRQRGGQQL